MKNKKTIQVIFKCCKLIPVLVGGILIQVKHDDDYDLMMMTVMMTVMMMTEAMMMRLMMMMMIAGEALRSSGLLGGRPYVPRSHTLPLGRH